MSKKFSRREMLRRTGKAAALGVVGFSFNLRSAQVLPPKSPRGAIIGEENGTQSMPLSPPH
jgi:hypothetical protein